MLVVVVLLLLWCFTTIQPAPVKYMDIEGCTLAGSLTTFSRLGLVCVLTSTNVDDVLHAIKQSEYLVLYLNVEAELQFGDEAFHPNLGLLVIAGRSFSISPGTFKGLSKLWQLYLSKCFLGTLHANNCINGAVEGYDENNTRYPFDMDYTFGAGWLSNLTYLEVIKVALGEFNGFRVAEFCTLNRLYELIFEGDIDIGSSCY